MKEIHPIAACYPKLPPEEYQELKDDIKRNGLIVPIVLYEDKVLDGVHRQLSCEELALSPIYVTPEIKDPYAYVVSLNERRRQLTTGQRAVIAERMAMLKRGTNRYQEKVDPRIRGSAHKNIALVESAKLNKVGATSVDEVRYAKEKGIPEIYQAIDNGKLKPYRAKEIASLPKDQQAEALKAALNGDYTIAKRQRGQRWPSRPKAKKETVGQRQARLQQMLMAGRKPGETVGLTREQVDPDFKGSPQEWVDKYGHVQIMTKAELEADRAQAAFNAWKDTLRDLKDAAAKYLETEPPKPEVLQAWIEKSNLPERRAKRLAEVKEWVSLIVRAKESIDWINGLEIFIKI